MTRQKRYHHVSVCSVEQQPQDETKQQPQQQHLVGEKRKNRTDHDDLSKSNSALTVTGEGTAVRVDAFAFKDLEKGSWKFDPYQSPAFQEFVSNRCGPALIRAENLGRLLQRERKEWYQKRRTLRESGKNISFDHGKAVQMFLKQRRFGHPGEDQDRQF
eukprot:CAMPEP_0175129906 /NCGR_PEP_ID=MMETSP0087-20121206/5726_1 /TAXON_ID=136419 /ORGANISM="Unknown Unknown, Strain D1" /LENGTH=158 /DNA_ID=CAMNT_0016412095 /DNA_START=232 /DNA_END=708 /DNA_ORIENTATION=-